MHFCKQYFLKSIDVARWGFYTLLYLKVEGGVKLMPSLSLSSGQYQQNNNKQKNIFEREGTNGNASGISRKQMRKRSCVMYSVTHRYQQHRKEIL